MGWREQLHQAPFVRNGQTVQAPGATFRGVPFHTADADVGVGRRNVVHEYPLRDEAYVEDLGRRARTFTVEGYVIGDDYLAQRDALWTALEASGPGELVHPRYGSVLVSVQDVARIKETPREGGMARFSITFVESGPNLLPNALADTSAQVADAADALATAAADAYGRAVDFNGPQVLAQTQIDSFTKDLTGLLAIVRQVTNTSALSGLVKSIGAMVGALTKLIRTPVTFVQGLMSLHLALAADVQRPLSALAEFRSVYGSNRRPVVPASLPGSTKSRMAVNDIARLDLQRRVALAQQARMLSVAIATAEVETASQALALRDGLLDQVDEELEQTDPDVATVRALTAVRLAVTRDVMERVEFLRYRSTFTSQAVLPAVYLAHRIYQDATRADELVLRNGVAHPAFVPAGPLEVLL